MKKGTIIILSTMVIGLMACKKSYTCTCTSDVDGSITNVSDYKLTPSDAESACSNADSEVDVSCVLE